MRTTLAQLAVPGLSGKGAATRFALGDPLSYLTMMNAEQFQPLAGILARALAREGVQSTATPGLRRAAVLIPIVLHPEPVSILLTLRTHFVETHKGQVSFPGGVVDPEDGDVVETALRESEEEIGISRRDVTVLGMMPDLATPTGFLITPVVGVLAQLPTLHLNASEVAEAFAVPLEFLADPASCLSEVVELGGQRRLMYRFEFGGKTIWGATALIVRSLLQLLDAHDEPTA